MSDEFIAVESKPIDLPSLTVEVGEALGYTRWEDSADHKGYSGLVMERTEEQILIGVVWTEDGVNGFVKPLSEPEKAAVFQVIVNHG